MKRYLPWITIIYFMISIALQPGASASALKPGARNDETYQVQARLTELGYLADSPDGTYGENTRYAVMNFQLDYGLEPDGIVGDATRQLLYDSRVQRQDVSRAAGEARKGYQIVSFAKQFLGVPYVWAGRSPAGFDCSGFTYYIYSQYNIRIPRMADEQFEVGLPVRKSELMPGDMVFFTTYEPGPSHVGIYMGNGQFIHASSAAEEVTITPLNKPYYVERYLGARRVVK